MSRNQQIILGRSSQLKWEKKLEDIVLLKASGESTSRSKKGESVASATKRPFVLSNVEFTGD